MNRRLRIKWVSVTPEPKSEEERMIACRKLHFFGFNHEVKLKRARFDAILHSTLYQAAYPPDQIPYYAEFPEGLPVLDDLGLDRKRPFIVYESGNIQGGGKEHDRGDATIDITEGEQGMVHSESEFNIDHQKHLVVLGSSIFLNYRFHLFDENPVEPERREGLIILP